MPTINRYLLCTALGLGLAACGDDGNADGGDDGSTGANMMDDGSTAGDDSPITTSPTTTSPTTTSPPGDSSDGTDDTGPGPEYDFDDTPPEDLAQVDRMGMPAINTAVISSKEDYNQASPADDAVGDFVSEIIANVTGLHAALDDDLIGAGFVPCMVDACVATAAPLVVPDTLKIDPAGPAGFPNGRMPADPVIDVTLAVVLLDLTVMGQDATTLAGLPLNPPENDVDFLGEFPFLAPPH
jgi:hypothetical protein